MRLNAARGWATLRDATLPAVAIAYALLTLAAHAGAQQCGPFGLLWPLFVIPIYLDMLFAGAFRALIDPFWLTGFVAVAMAFAAAAAMMKRYSLGRAYTLAVVLVLLTIAVWCVEGSNPQGVCLDL